jgi:CHAT domain-containing protein
VQALAGLAARTKPDPAALGSARAGLDGAYAELDGVDRRIQREVRRVADVVHPMPVALADARRELAPGEALILYQLASAWSHGGAQALALVLTRDAVRLVELGDGDVVARRVEAYLGLVSAAGAEEAGAVEEERARGLYDALLRPLEPDLAGRSRLLLSPDGALCFLPFEALVRAEEGKRERALERWEIAYVPSATVLSALRRDAKVLGRGSGILALGDPAYPDETKPAPGVVALRGWGRLERLPETAEEARQVAALFPERERSVLLRENASREGLRESLARAAGRLRALHLACHGFVDPVRPRLTGLVLAGGERLSLDDLHQMRVPADLAVLSACETGRGRLQRGEGLMGLARGFFLAGVPSVVVTNWKVGDAAARPRKVAF